MTDEIVEEIHSVRRKIWEACDCNFKKLTERYMRLQEEHPELVVWQVPRPAPTPAPTTTEDD